MDIGRKGWIGIGLESTAGSPVAIVDYVPFTENTLQGMHETISNEASYGVRDRVFDTASGKKWSEGSLAVNVDGKYFGYLLIGALGTDTPANVAGSVYDHVITRNNSNTPQTMTITQARGSVDEQYYRGVAVKTLEVSVSDGLAEGRASLIGQFPITTTSGSLTTASGGLFTFGDARFAFGASVSAAGSNTNLKPSDFKLTIENNTVARFRHGSLDATDIMHGEFEATAEGTLFFEGTTQRDYYYNNSKNAASFSMTGRGIGGGYNESLEFRMYRTAYEGFDLETGLADFYAEKFTVRCAYDNANSKSIDAVLRNTTSSY